MFTTLVAVIVALTLGHVAPALAGSLRRFAWLERWIRWLDAHAGGLAVWRDIGGATLALAPPLLVMLALQWGLAGIGYGLPSLLFGVLVLVWTWGPRDLDRDVEAVIDADDPSSRRLAIAHLQAAGGSLHEDAASLAAAVVINGLRRWFAVAFWFLVLGPFGALAYRLNALLAEGMLSERLPDRNREGAQRLLAVLEWPVAQLMTLSMALVGDFNSVYRAWREARGGHGWLVSESLGAAARASVSGELREQAHDYLEAGLVPVWRRLPELRDAMSLMWRVLLLWLAVLALLVIAGWVT